MDLLFSRYASPFLLLDGYIKIGRFSDFVDKFVEIENENNMWEYFLHKVFDKTYEEFKNSVETSNETISDEQLETTIKNSQNIMNGFIPERG